MRTTLNLHTKFAQRLAVAARLFVLVSCFFLFADSAIAIELDDDSDVLSSRNSAASSERLRLKQYAGGRDEQDLRVQQTLLNPSRGLENQNLEKTSPDSADDMPAGSDL